MSERLLGVLTRPKEQRNFTTMPIRKEIVVPLRPAENQEELAEQVDPPKTLEEYIDQNT